MKIGMPILYEFDNLEQNFILAKELGFDFIELNLNFKYCQDEVKNYKHLKNLINAYNIEITLHFFDEADFGTYKEITKSYYKLLKKLIKNPIKCGLKNLVIHLSPGPVCTISGVKNYIYEKEFSDYINRLLKALNKINNYCIKNNVNLCIENSKTVPYMKKVYEILHNNNFNFTFDIGHNEVCNNIVWNIYNEIGFNIKEFHVHDVDNNNYDHISLGEGQINFKKYYDIINNNNIYSLLELKKSEDLKKSIIYFKNIK